MTSRYAIDLNAPDKITLRRRDAVVEALCALDIHDIVLRGIAVVVEGEPVLDLHVDFETEKFHIWIAISQQFDQIIVYRDRKGEYERSQFFWEPLTPDGELNKSSLERLRRIVLGLPIED